jgi:hypothetical protein
MKQKAIRIPPWAPPELSFGEMAAVTIGGLFMLVLGIWAFFAPASFADFVAFPYNRHLLHDVGAFQIGIGTTMLLALMWKDGVTVVLAGYVVGSSFHLLSHILDRHIGGHSYDPLVLGVMVTVGLAGMYLRSQVVLRSRRHRGALVVGYGEGACPEHNRPADGL